jgi:cardiolipin synthase
MKALESLASRAYSRIADAQQSNGNKVQLLRDGPETYPAWLAAIAAATATIHLENYILQEDFVGQQFADALLAAAARGVKICLLYDWLGCFTRTSKTFWSQFDHPNIERRAYNPLNPLTPIRWVSRDHRKVLVIDEAVAFTGGLCIGHAWMGGPDPKHPEKILPPWRDTAVRIEGPAVAYISAAFVDSWHAAGATTLPRGKPLPDLDQPEPPTGLDVSVIAGHPTAMRLYRLEQLVAEIAEEKLWLTDGYFVATTAYVRALAGAARAGVDVRLIVPGSSDWPLVGTLSQTSFRPLLEAGVRIFEWNGPMVHAKTAVADGIWTRIGSSNSNLASWVSNRELDVTITDADFAAQMEAMFEQDMQNCTEVLLQPGRTGINRPKTGRDKKFSRPSRQKATRFLSGAIGIGSTVRATFTQTRQLGPGELFILAGAAAALMVLALIAAFLPRLLAWPLAFIFLWSALALAIHAAKLWRHRDATSHPPTQ